MIIVGAKGFAKELLEIFHQQERLEDLVFFDDVSIDLPSKIYDKFPIITSKEEAIHHFENIESGFCIGTGNPMVRKKLQKKFTEFGGTPISIISELATIGHYGNQIGAGTVITSGSVLTNDIIIGAGCLINLNCSIGHDVRLGDFVECCPGVSISGNVSIGENTFIGTNATVLPGVHVGSNVMIGAGAVVTSDVPDSVLVTGVPGEIKKKLSSPQ